jgi:cobalt/nickel transport system permease protein
VGLKSNNFIERSILGALSFLKESIFAEEYSAKSGLLQSLDPRVKAGSVFLFIVGMLLCKNIYILFSCYALCLVLAVFSRINLGFFLKRTWIFIPLFSFFIAVPALFGFFSPGETIFSFQLFGFHLAITRQGLSGATLFVTRVITSVSFAVLLSLTTRHFQLLRVLRIFGVPQIFVMTLGMCYRYVYLFVEMLENTYRAIKSRVGSSMDYRKGQSIVAGNIAFLWERSLRLNEQVYQSMLSRGYQGEVLIIDDFKMRSRDWLWLAGSGVVVLSMFYFSLVLKI